LAGKYEKAVEAFYRTLETDRSQRTYNNLGLVLSKLGRYREAFEAFKKAGTEAEAYNNLGCVYLQQGEYAKAIRSFKKAIELKPAFYIKASENLKKAKMDYPMGNEGKKFRHADSKGDEQYIPTEGPSNTSKGSEMKKSEEEISALLITREAYDKASYAKKPSETSTGTTSITTKQELKSPETPEKRLVREKIYSEGSKYAGEWKDNKMHGHGTLTWPNGVKYVGTFEAGRATGGWMSKHDADKAWVYQDYEGNWIITER